ncbi:hypothetical protein FOZ60_003367 [Perkinsus olseni]|uniref:Uncharacterized protein n=1 Tax=Perkinsus olseni TaxID=32597 RepID=A0A7J6PJW0_PEROL|nr:hypothetical protein FOZ60_003367 [Perkinsus olseni]
MRQLQQQRSNDADTSSSGLGLRQGLNDPLCIVCFENMWNTSLSPCGKEMTAPGIEPATTDDPSSGSSRSCPLRGLFFASEVLSYLSAPHSSTSAHLHVKATTFMHDISVDVKQILYLLLVHENSFLLDFPISQESSSIGGHQRRVRPRRSSNCVCHLSLFLLEIAGRNLRRVFLSRPLLKLVRVNNPATCIMPVLFLDCDDTLYWKDRREVGRLLTQNIGKYIHQNFGLDSSAGYSLYSKYGTCVKGLIEEGYIAKDDDAEIARYFDETHALSELRDLVPPDSAVRQMICRLGIAMNIAGVSDPSACILVDDSPANLEAAKQVGWRTVLVNPDGALQGPFPGVDYVIDNVTLLPTVLPECFNPTADESEASSDDEIISVSVNPYTGKRSRHIESIDTAPSESQFASFSSDIACED